jgi:hypothetical protein
MATLKRTRNLLLTSAAAAVALGLGASLAFAAVGGPAHHAVSATTWTVSPGGAAKAVAGKVSIKDTTTGSLLTCTSASAAGTVKSGSGLSGTHLGQPSQPPSFEDCQGGPGFKIFWIWENTNEIYINAQSYNAAKGITTGDITGLHASGSTTGCSFVVDGTSGSSDNGLVKGTYTNATGKGTVLATGGNLHFWDVSGCFGLYNNGDAAEASGSFTVTPKMTAVGS